MKKNKNASPEATPKKDYQQEFDPDVKQKSKSKTAVIAISAFIALFFLVLLVWYISDNSVKEQAFDVEGETAAAVVQQGEESSDEVIEVKDSLLDLTKETVYIIFDHNKTYSLLRDDEAFAILYSTVMMGMVLDLSTAKNVSAKTTVYSGKTAVAEIYTDKDLSAKKTLYFINDKIKAMKVTYSDGSSETLKISKINDTPTSSVFKLPKGYKKVSY